LNNVVEQDHRFIKKHIRSMLGLKSFDTAISILSGVKAMHMIKTVVDNEVSISCCNNVSLI